MSLNTTMKDICVCVSEDEMCLKHFLFTVSWLVSLSF